MKRLPMLLVAAVLVAPAALADGAATYKSKCAVCHGADGKGKTPTGRSLRVRDLGSDEVQSMKNEEMQKIIADGKGTMQAFKDSLDQAGIDELVTFIRTLKPQK